MTHKWLGIGFERWILGTVDVPFRLGSAGDEIHLDGFALTWSGSARNDAISTAPHVRQALCTLYNPTLQWATPLMGQQLRAATNGENYSLHNGLFSINLKQRGVTPVHVFTPVKYDQPILIPGGELRINVALQTEGSSLQTECLNIEVQGTFFFHTP